MRTILIPTDFSPAAWTAIEHTFKLFREDNCRMVLLHAYVPAFYRLDYAFGGPEVSAIEDPDTALVLSKFQQLQDKIEEEFPSHYHEVDIHGGFNTLPSELNKVAEEREADLIVIGTEGITGWKDKLMGNTTSTVIKNCHIPLLVIPESSQYKMPKRVVLATDLATTYRMGDLDSLLWICGEQIEKLTVLHLKEDLALTAEQEVCKRELRSLLRDQTFEYRELEKGLMPDGLLEYIDDHEADLTVITRHKHTFLERAILRQHSESISSAIHSPLLIIPESEG